MYVTWREVRKVAAAAVLAIAGSAFAQDIDRAAEEAKLPDGSAVAGTASFDASAIRAALASPSVAGFVTQVTPIGGLIQSTATSTPQAGFPIEGGSYAVVSAGNADFVGSGASFGCAWDPYGDAWWSWLCGLGGFEVKIALPPYAEEISFAYRFFEVDYSPFEDPFRVFLVPADGAPVKIAQSTLSSEFGSKGYGFAWSQNLRQVSYDVSAYAGQEIALRFLASNMADNLYPSGALIDGLALTVKPPPAVAITSPASGAWVRGATALTADVTSQSGVASVTFTIDGQASVAAAGPAEGGSWGATFDTLAPPALADGPHSLGAHAVAANTLTADAPPTAFNVDNTIPSLQISTPLGGAYLKGVVTIAAQADDHDATLTQASGVAGIVLKVNGGEVKSCAFDPPQAAPSCVATFDTAALQDGPFLVTAEVADLVGNAAASSATPIADNSKPAKFLLSPLPGQTVSTSVDVSVNVLDDYFASVACTLDGATLFQSQNPEVGVTQSVLGLLDGTHTVACSAVDLAGNSGDESADFVVKNWNETLHPETLSLVSAGGDLSVTLYVEGPNVDLLLPLAGQIALVVPGAAPVPATPYAGSAALGDVDADGVPDLTIKFDRQAVIAAVKSAGASSSGPLLVEFSVGGKKFGSALVAVLGK